MDSLVNRTDTVVGTTDFNAVNQQFLVVLRDLEPNTTYYYRLVAMNSVETRESEVMNVTTRPRRESMHLVHVHLYHVQINHCMQCSTFSSSSSSSCSSSSSSSSSCRTPADVYTESHHC